MDKSNYNSLIQVLKLIAANFDLQVTKLPAYVHVPDEIALLFEDVFNITDNEEQEFFSPKALNGLNALEKRFIDMSKDQSLWNLQALQRHQHWDSCRVIAREILYELRESNDEPNLDFVTWVT